ncbi:hypothetical protein SAMN04489720_0990 [Agrococcus jejuensis]|uniref:Uncharacterized protein n=1 Tax=Agrococcus jejuensis TaxID=399736 RepID=A0A1G8BM95_9MICO|nr:hypothetical protein SAMN04489720_0990 [Agrococcus jejuensis]
MSARGPFGIRVPQSRTLLRGLAVAVAAASCLVALLMASSGAIGDASSPTTRILVAGSVLVTSALGAVGGLVLAVVGPWRARATTAIAFALAGVAGAVGYGVDLAGGPLAPTALTVVVAVALVVHLLAAPALADDEP